MPGKIHGIVQYAKDFDAFAGGTVENDVPPFMKACRCSWEIMTFPAKSRLVSQNDHSIF
jgi:hypothetical protein